MMQEVLYLIRKEIMLEWKQKYAFNGLILYAICTVFVVYMAFIEIDPVAWLSILWIILLFCSVNAVAKSFVQESGQRQLYYYTLHRPEAVIISKIIYNTILLVILGALAVGLYHVFLGNPVEDAVLFYGTLFLGACCFSLTLTMISAIAAKAGNTATLLPILSFPVLLPVLIILIRISKVAVSNVGDVQMQQNITVLIAINGILIALSYILFPYLWRD